MRIRRTKCEKPPYRVPTMAEVRATPRCGLRVVSTFSGAGGSCLGFRMAGFEVLWASEFVEAARVTYRANFPETHVDARDIRAIRPEEILAVTGLRAGELDVLEGSPPCASFSTAGKREKHWGEVKKYSDVSQRTDDLFFEFARVLAGLRPRAFVAENVYGLVKGVAKGYFKEIHAALEAAGYVVRAKLLDAQWLGVPQTRQRVIFIGAREDLGVEPQHPAPLPYRYSLREALGFGDGYEMICGNDAFEPRWGKTDAPSPTIVAAGGGRTSGANRSARAAPSNIRKIVHDTSGLFSVGDVTDRPAPAITVGVNSVNASHFKDFEVRGGGEAPALDGYAIGAELRRTKLGGRPARYFNLRRPAMGDASPCVTATGGVAGAASVVHPSGARKFTIAELRRICSFPDDFVLTGTYQQQWERCGRAVPPLMMRAIAESVRAMLLGTRR